MKKKLFTVFVALVLVLTMSVTAFARWSTIKSTTLNISATRATASISSWTADLSIEIELYEDDVLIAYDSAYRSSSQSLALSIPYTFRSGREYMAIAYFDADGETHTMTAFRN